MLMCYAGKLGCLDRADERGLSEGLCLQGEPQRGSAGSGLFHIRDIPLTGHDRAQSGAPHRLGAAFRHALII
jgi:hypothetical protein